jgi:glucose-1-phosphate adenylyltransferase
VRPIYTHSRTLPGSFVEDRRLERVLLCEGCRISHAEISDSVIGVRSLVGKGARIRSSVLMGSDEYDLPSDGGKVPIGIGPGADVTGAILDKNACIGEGVIIRPWPRGTADIDTRSYVVRDGVVVVPKDAIIPPGTRIGPD